LHNGPEYYDHGDDEWRIEQGVLRPVDDLLRSIIRPPPQATLLRFVYSPYFLYTIPSLCPDEYSPGIQVPTSEKGQIFLLEQEGFDTIQAKAFIHAPSFVNKDYKAKAQDLYRVINEVRAATKTWNSMLMHGAAPGELVTTALDMARQSDPILSHESTVASLRAVITQSTQTPEAAWPTTVSSASHMLMQCCNPNGNNEEPIRQATLLFDSVSKSLAAVEILHLMAADARRAILKLAESKREDVLREAEEQRDNARRQLDARMVNDRRESDAIADGTRSIYAVQADAVLIEAFSGFTPAQIKAVALHFLSQSHPDLVLSQRLPR
jgi:hypothetical protein